VSGPAAARQGSGAAATAAVTRHGAGEAAAGWPGDRGSRPDPDVPAAAWPGDRGSRPHPDVPAAAWLGDRGSRPGRRRVGFLRLVATGVEGFLLEPAEAATPEPVPPVDLPPRPVIAVHGLARRCGATVVARALAAELATRDPAGTAAVASRAPSGGIPLATSAAGRLADALGEAPGATTTAVGRLCLVEGGEVEAIAAVAREHAPLIVDAGAGPLDSDSAGVADHVLLVATPATEPSLTRVVAHCVRGLGHEPTLVLNRARAAASSGSFETRLPESRMGAQLALGGRQAHGELGRAIAVLADRLGA
jgi:hypothetical protein